MESLELIKRRISSAQSLKSIVRTMKILAAVSMRQYEKMLDALKEYVNNIEMGLQVSLKDFKSLHELKETSGGKKTGAIIFGSDMGMCGQFNELISSYAVNSVSGINSGELEVISIGDRVAAKLPGRGFNAPGMLPYPAGLSGNVKPVMQELLLRIESWREQKGVGQVLLFYNAPSDEGVRYAPQMKMLLPLSKEYLEKIKAKKWESNTIPMYKMERNALFSALIKDLLYAELFRAFVDSLTSENAARLASMQAAEKHVDDHIEELNGVYNQERQDQITSELLDIIAGFEAVTN
jgi:F-type H+-transporting ATPase subunit gamma